MAESPIDDIFTHERDYLHNVSIDNVIFGYHGKELKVLLQQPFGAGKWTVTGGYIRRTESIEEAAARIATARTGLKNLFLLQFRAFGNPRRTADNGFTAAQLSGLTRTEVRPDAWIFDYFVSVAFYTLTEFSKVEVTKSPLEADCAWWPVGDLPPMLFDHELIVREALAAMRIHIAHFPIGYQLLETKFTMPEIRSLYETILGRSLDDRNFSKKLMATGILIKLGETRRIGAHRSPYLYQFNKTTYEEALKTGIELAF
jgi:ADP-ribose pyrophosphatase YjhB (NUDIX family)